MFNRGGITLLNGFDAKKREELAGGRHAKPVGERVKPVHAKHVYKAGETHYDDQGRIVHERILVSGNPKTFCKFVSTIEGYAVVCVDGEAFKVPFVEPANLDVDTIEEAFEIYHREALRATEKVEQEAIEFIKAENVSMRQEALRTGGQPQQAVRLAGQ